MHVSVPARFIGPFVVLGNLLEHEGDAVAQHKHPYGHISYVVTGKVCLMLETDAGERTSRDCGPGEPFFVPPHTKHSFLALAPWSRVDCIVQRSDWDLRSGARTDAEC